MSGAPALTRTIVERRAQVVTWTIVQGSRCAPGERALTVAAMALVRARLDVSCWPSIGGDKAAVVLEVLGETRARLVGVCHGPACNRRSTR